MLDRLLDVFAPHICCSCGRQNALLCEYCHYDIVSEAFHRCIVCLKPTVDTNLCSRCRPAAVYDDAWCVNERSDGLKELIDRYKFDRARAGAAILASLLDEAMPQLPTDTVVTYIPDIASHRRQRGYDHMALVAKLLARRRSYPCRPLLVRETSLSQRGASKVERAKRQAGAFRVDETIDSPTLLIDDIYTTGATINAGAAAIRAVSGQPLFVAVVARQPFDR
jgi:ComF family protein